MSNFPEGGSQQICSRRDGRPGSFLFRNGRVIDPARNIDKIADVLIVDGRLMDIQSNFPNTMDWMSRDNICVASRFVSFTDDCRIPSSAFTTGGL